MVRPAKALVGALPDLFARPGKYPMGPGKVAMKASLACMALRPLMGTLGG